MTDIALTVIFILVTVAVAFVAYHGGRDAAERQTDNLVSSLRAKNRILIRELEHTREDAAQARRLAIQARRRQP